MSQWTTNPRIKIGGYPIEMMKFPDGALNVRIPEIKSGLSAQFSAVILSSDDLIALLLSVDAFTRAYRMPGHLADKKILTIPFFPYARQDRVCNAGESLSVSVIAGIINSLNFDEVVISDPHSDVVGALIKNAILIDRIEYLTEILQKHQYDCLASPDAGAEKKVFASAKELNLPVIRFSKTRDVATGAITGFNLVDGLHSKSRILVVDDICDGGRTFVELAKSLAFASPVTLDLFVTHGIFSNGFDELQKYYQNIFFSNSLGQVEEASLFSLNTKTFIQ